MFRTPIHWVRDIAPHRLGLMPRPRGGEQLAEEVEGWRLAAVDRVVSLLEPREMHELELRKEATLCAAQGIAFHHFPIPDRGVPGSDKNAAALIDDLHAELARGQAIAVHCRAGIGRTGLIAACLLHRLGVPRGDVFHTLSRSRGLAMPDTESQIAWFERYARSTPTSRTT